MEKCWFTLTQTHYPLPTTGPPPKGPIQLGHLFSSLSPLPTPINVVPGPRPFPTYMPIYLSRLTNLHWQSTTSSKISASANASLPIPQTLGLVSAGGGASSAFQKSVSRFWCFDSVDAEIIQPDERYIEQSLAAERVRAWIEKRRGKSRLGTWSMFMVTGLAIARGVKGRNGVTEDKGWSVDEGPKVSVSGIVDVDVTGKIDKSGSMEMTFDSSSDFVWAIQVMKISKRFLSSEWSHEPYVKGATYTVEEDEEDDEAVQKMLNEEGISFESIHRDEDDIFVIPSEKGHGASDLEEAC